MSTPADDGNGGEPATPADTGQRQSADDTQDPLGDEDWVPPSLSERIGLGETEHTQSVLYTLGLFLVVGASFGLMSVLMELFRDSTTGQLGFSVRTSTPGALTEGLLVAVIYAPLIATLAGMLVALVATDRSVKTGAVVGFGALLGYLALLASIFIVGTLAGDATGTMNEQIGENIMEFVVPVGAVAVAGFGATWLTSWFLPHSG